MNAPDSPQERFWRTAANLVTQDPYGQSWPSYERIVSLWKTSFPNGTSDGVDADMARIKRICRVELS